MTTQPCSLIIGNAGTIANRPDEVCPPLYCTVIAPEIMTTRSAEGCRCGRTLLTRSEGQSVASGDVIEQGAQLIERDGLYQMGSEAGVLGAFHILVHSVTA